MSEIKQIITHFTDTDLYKLTMACAIIDNYPRAVVKYEFIDRDNRIYPDGFINELNRQILLLDNVIITDEEIEFLKRKCYYLPNWFYTYLKGFRFNHNWVHFEQDDEGHLHGSFEGEWSNTVLLEVMIMAIISELYYIMTNKNIAFDYDEYYKLSYKKCERLLDAGCIFSDFGVRRRSDFKTEEIVIKAFKDCYQSRNWESLTGGKFVGTSNVYLAMKYDLTPIGTMAHEFICGIAGMYGGPTMANHLAMEAWRHTYRGALGVMLYDSFGWDIFNLNFSEDFANQFRGLRIDSGNNFEQLKKIVDKYKSLGIDPKTKQIVFSNALTVDTAINIHNVAKDVCQPSFGIGTHFTNDYKSLGVDIKPSNMVIKLVAIKMTEKWSYFNDTCKLSEDMGKHTGKPNVIKRFMESLSEYADELNKMQ